jgi:hypothetical protein
VRVKADAMRFGLSATSLGNATRTVARSSSQLRDGPKFRGASHGPSGRKPFVAGAGEQFSSLQRRI